MKFKICDSGPTIGGEGYALGTLPDSYPRSGDRLGGREILCGSNERK